MSAQSLTCCVQPASASSVGSMTSPAACAQVTDAVEHPVHVLLDRNDHVRQHRGTAGTGDEKQVGEADRGQPEVGLRPVRPFVLQRQVVSAPDVDGRDRTRHGVETGGEDDRVEGERLVGGVDARLGDLPDRMFSDVDQAYVRKVVGGVVVRIQAWPFRGDGVIGRAQIGRRLRVIDDRADLVPEELGELVVGRGIAQHVGVNVDRLEQ